ncbi:hypothetical protein SK128_021324, partial [Halocaridina rubra]
NFDLSPFVAQWIPLWLASGISIDIESSKNIYSPSLRQKLNWLYEGEDNEIPQII